MMTQDDLTIQRYTQLRNEIKDAIEKIPLSVDHLEKTSQLLASHFDVFRELVKNTREQIPAILKSASHDLASASEKQLSEKLDTMLKDKIRRLDKSIQDASDILDRTMTEKYKKLILFTTLGSILCGVAGFGVGYFCATYSGYRLPADFEKAYELGKYHMRISLLEKRVKDSQKKIIKK